MKKFALILTVLILTFLLSSCGTTDIPDPTATVFILGSHNNFPFSEATFSAFEDAVYEAAYSYGEIAFVVVDGESFLEGHYKIKPPTANVDNTKRRMIAEDQTAEIMQLMASAAAKTPEVNTLAALSIASDLLSASSCESKNIILADSALQTAGTLNFSSGNLLDADPERIVSDLESMNAIPDLTDVSIETVGLGQTCGTQKKLTPDMQKKLTDIWDAIFSAAGANVIYNKTPLPITESRTDLPYVSTVTVVESSIHYDEISREDEAAEPETIIPEVIRFDETKIGFKANTVELLSEDDAVDVLLPIAKLLSENKDLTVYLAGMTASSGGSGSALSLERAECIKSLLEKMGCDTERILCVGLGRSENHLRVPDLDANGHLIAEAAAKNRAVFLFSKDSETARRLGLN